MWSAFICCHKCILHWISDTQSLMTLNTKRFLPSKYANTQWLATLRLFTEWMCRYTYPLIFRSCFKVAGSSVVKYPGNAECILSFRYDLFEAKHMSSQIPLFEPLWKGNAQFIIVYPRITLLINFQLIFYNSPKYTTWHILILVLSTICWSHILRWKLSSFRLKK